MSAFTVQTFLLPQGFPRTASAPKFHLGDRVRFIPMPIEDYGIVTGFQYAPAEHLQDWAWRYTLWLDPQSPSSAWVRSDTAWEDDLQSVTPPATVLSTEEPSL